ncbi:MAG TPA: SRPBCC family protein, partial [Streptosporangiaceae bacterium]
KVLEVEEDRKLVYTVIGGIPVRNYRAEVTLTPVADGTRIRWAASWDTTLAGRLVQRGLRKFYPQMMAALVAAAEQRSASSPP